MAITSLKMIQIRHIRCFLTFTDIVNVKNTLYARFGSFLRKLWPFESLLPSFLPAVGGPLTYFWTFFGP